MLEDVDKKATEASDSYMAILHSAKQNVVAKNTKYLDKKNRNPDCYKVGNYIALRLPYAKQTDEPTFAASTDLYIIDNKGNYYAVIGPVPE